MICRKKSSRGLGMLEVLITLCAVLFLTMLLLKNRKKEETKMVQTLEANGVKLEDGQKATPQNVQGAVINKMDAINDKHQQRLEEQADKLGE